MRRLLSALVALIVSASVVWADNVVLPVKCVGTNSGFAVRTGIVASYAIVGGHKEREHKVCANGNARRCTTLKIHKFDVDCDGRRVAFQALAGAMIRARGAVARTSKGRLNFRLVKPSFASLNPVCETDKFAADKTGAVQRWSLDSNCRAAGYAPRKTVVLPIGFAPLAELGGRIVAKSEAPSGLHSPAGYANAAKGTLARNPPCCPIERLGRRCAGSKSKRPARHRKVGRAPCLLPSSKSRSHPQLPWPFQVKHSTTTSASAVKPRDRVTEREPKQLLPSLNAPDKKAPEESLPVVTAAAPAVVEPVNPRPTKIAAATTKATGTSIEKTRTVQIAAAGKTAVAAEATSPSSWDTLVKVVSRRTGEPSAQQQVQHSMVATILGLALVTSLVSGIGWFATQQLLVARKSKSDPYQLILKREVTDLAKPDAQMCGELCRTGQTLIGDIHSRVEQIKGAAALRRVLTREVRSMEQFLSATLENAPEDPREWRRTRLRLQRVVTDLIRLKDITDGARRSLTSKLISDELPRDKQEAYEMLGANAEASEKILKRLVDALRATWHPDLAANEDDLVLRNRRIKQINVAWDLISEKRSEA